MALKRDIPQNVANSIVDALVASNRHQWLSPYSVVSRHFQKAIEAHTFRELYLTSARLNELGTIVTRKRQASVNVVTLHVALPPYKDWQREEKESQEDADRTTRVFNSTMHELFATMSTWSLKHASPGGIHFELLVESPSDEYTTSSSRSTPSITRRARVSAAALDGYEQALPKVAVVSAFTCSGSGRHIKLETVSLLLEKLPSLRLLDTELEHDTADEKDLEQRRTFVLGLEHYAPNVTELRFRRPHTPPESQRVSSSNSRSLFYGILTRYTLRCTALTFDDCIDAREYLAPFEDDGELGHQQPYWPYLESLHIRNSFLMRSPYMRVQTRAQAMQKIERIFILAGRALRYMPVVRDIKIKLYVFREARLEQITAKYEAWNGGARMRFTGMTPKKAMLGVWKTSVKTARGVELQVR